MLRHHTIDGAGVAMNVVETGPVDAPSILLIHGWSQCHLSWRRQLDSALADRFRLVAPDLRGHGMSGKPDAASAYTDSRLWADDIAAILATLQLKQPVLLGWSMGGWVLGDYLRHYGDAGLAGFGLVGSFVTTGKKMPAEALAHRGQDPDVGAKGMYSDDLATNLAATRAFVKACFATSPAPDDLAEMVGFNMLVPPRVRSAARGRSEDYRSDYARTTRPAAIFHGAQERLSLPPVLAEIDATLPRASRYIYPDAGHAPFWEVPNAFNRDLTAFAETAVAQPESLAS